VYDRWGWPVSDFAGSVGFGVCGFDFVAAYVVGYAVVFWGVLS